MLVTVSQKKAKDTQPSRENPPSSAATAASSESKTQSTQPDNEAPPSKGSSVANGKNGKERTDNPVPPSPANSDIGTPKDTSLQENRGNGNGTHSTPPGTTETSQKEEPAFEDIETENTENETFSGSTSRKIPVVIVIGFLEHILNEELPKDSDVKLAILSKLTEKIDRVLSNVE